MIAFEHAPPTAVQHVEHVRAVFRAALRDMLAGRGARRSRRRALSDLALYARVLLRADRATGRHP